MFSNLYKNRLYKISDFLCKNQGTIESALYPKEQGLFNLSEVVTLYDLTHTYFAENSLKEDNAVGGYSKEKRIDCKISYFSISI